MEAHIGRKNACNTAQEMLETKQPLTPCMVLGKGCEAAEKLVPVCTGVGHGARLPLRHSVSLQGVVFVLEGKVFSDTPYCCNLVLKL